MQMAAIALRDHQPPLDLPLLLPQFTPLSQLRPSTYLPGVILLAILQEIDR